MSRNPKWLLFLFGIVAAVFVFELTQLFILRFESGDVYPPYSSYRADPLGARAFYEALQDVPELTVQRNHDALLSGEVASGQGQGKTLFICGASLSKDPESILAALERYVAAGARLVITFSPVDKKREGLFDFDPASFDDDEDENEADKDAETKADGTDAEADGADVEADGADAEADSADAEADGADAEADGADAEADGTDEDHADDADDKDESSEEGSDDDDDDVEPPWAQEYVSIEDRWGFAFAYGDLTGATEESFGTAQVERTGGPEDLPEVLTWHSALCFEDADETWQPIYARTQGAKSWVAPIADFFGITLGENARAVVMERPWGKGSIILCSDSYLISNQAVQGDRQANFLAWLAGPSASAIIFDETHLGLQHNPGVMALMRRYRLTGFLFAAIAAALLYVWKNITSLTPKRDAAAESAAEDGRDAATALVNLLRRSIPPNDVLTACVAEWRRSGPHSPGAQAGKIEAILRNEYARPPRERNPVRAYRAISDLIEQRKGVGR